MVWFCLLVSGVLDIGPLNEGGVLRLKRKVSPERSWPIEINGSDKGIVQVLRGAFCWESIFLIQKFILDHATGEHSNWFLWKPKPNKTGRKPGFELEISLKSPYNWGVCTEVSGTKMVGPQDMENCLLLVRMVALFVAPGRKESWRVMVNLFQPTEVVIRVSGLLVWNRVKGPSPGRMVWNLRAASTKMQLLRGLYACPQAW